MPKEYENKSPADISGKEYFNVLALRAKDVIKTIEEDKTPEIKSLNYLVESLLKRLKELQALFYTEKPHDPSLNYLIQAINENEITAIKVDEIIDAVETVIFKALKRRLQYYATLSTMGTEDNLLITETDDEIVVNKQQVLNTTELFSCKKFFDLLSECSKKDELLRLFDELQPKSEDLSKKRNYDNSRSDLSIHSASEMSTDSELENFAESNDDESDDEEAKAELYPLNFTLKSTRRLDSEIKTENLNPSENTIIKKEELPKSAPPPANPAQPIIRDTFKLRHKVLLSVTLIIALGTLGGVIGLMTAPVLGPLAVIVGGGIGLSLGGVLALKVFCGKSQKIPPKPFALSPEEVKPTTLLRPSTMQLLKGQKLKTVVEKNPSAHSEEAQVLPVQKQAIPDLGVTSVQPIRRRGMGY